MKRQLVAKSKEKKEIKLGDTEEMFGRTSESVERALLRLNQLPVWLHCYGNIGETDKRERATRCLPWHKMLFAPSLKQVVKLLIYHNKQRKDL